MPSFFVQKPGTVVRVGNPQQSGVLPFSIRMESLDVGGVVNPGSRAIVTQAAIVQEGNYQFLHTLADTIYVYVFGDKIGELRVSGVAFASLCQGEGTGMDQIIDNYDKNKLSRRGSPVLVSYGAQKVFRAFLIGMSLEVTDPERILGQWAYRFKMFPGRG